MVSTPGKEATQDVLKIVFAAIQFLNYSPIFFLYTVFLIIGLAELNQK